MGITRFYQKKKLQIVLLSKVLPALTILVILNLHPMYVWADEAFNETEARIRAIAAFGSDGGTGGLIKRLFMIALPVAIILGLALIAKSGYMIMTSQGDPRRITEGKENLTAAIIGLLFVLLSIAILRVIIGTLITDVSF